MILGSETLRPMLRALVPDAEIIGRPRFSTLTYAGAEEALAPAQALGGRRLLGRGGLCGRRDAAAAARRRGGGDGRALARARATRRSRCSRRARSIISSPPTRSAWGSTWTSRMSPSPACASSTGARTRRLTVPEMAQIAGRAGRHQRDGTFGTLGSARTGAARSTPEEVMAIEGHHFPPLDHLYWRCGTPDFGNAERADRQPRGAGRRCPGCAPRPRRSTSPCSSGSPASPTSSRPRARRRR